MSCSPEVATSLRPRFSERLLKQTLLTELNSLPPLDLLPSCLPSLWVADCFGKDYVTVKQHPWCSVSGSLRLPSWLGTLLVSCSTLRRSWQFLVPLVSLGSGNGLDGADWSVLGRNSESAHLLTESLQHVRQYGELRNFQRYSS